MHLSENIRYVLNKLQENGFEGFVVGGAVRDFLMNKEPKDLDVTTSAKPEDVKKIFKKTFDTGIEHGTVTVVVNKENIEVTTYRIDGEYLNNRKPNEVFFTSSLYEDLVRRDFTINAIAYNDEKGFVDNFNGQEDIKNKILRAVGEKEQRFIEDSLRIYRGIRFTSQLGFTIEDETLKAMENQKHLTKNLSVERVREEFLKSLKGNYPKNLSFYKKLEVLKFYDEDFYSHFNDNLDTLVTLLENNIAKDNTKEDAILLSLCFLNYEESKIEPFLKEFKVKNNDIKKTLTIIKGYKDLANHNLESITDIDVRKLLNKYDVTLFDILYVYSLLNDSYNLKEMITNNLDTPYSLKSLCLGGNDLISLNIGGKDIGKYLNFLLEKVIENPSLNDKNTLLNILKEEKAF